MRTTILTILLTLSMFAGIELTKADNSIPNNPEIPIILLEEDREKGRPRTLIQDIEAYHSNNMVYFTFNKNLGQANIVITNTDTGAHIQTTAANSCCNLHVNITDLGLGELNVLITTENGTKYIGTFTNF